MKRFVTYIYEYDRGNRGRNVGFIRTDIRDDFCRMELHIRGLDRVKGKGKVYLAVYDNAVIGVPAGEILLSQGTGNLTLTCPKNLLGQSGYNVNDIQAVVIRYGNGKLLIGSFVNEPAQGILHGGFTEWTANSSRRNSEESADLNPSPSTHPETPSVDTAGSTQAVVSPVNSGDSSSFIPEKPAYADAAASAQPKDFVSNVINLMQSNTKVTNDANSVSEQTVSTTAPTGRITPQDFLQTLLAGGPSKSSPADSVTGSSEDAVSKPQKETPHPPTITAQESTPAPDKSVTGDSEQPQASYRRIEITDIRSLPRRNWYLCNNSFLVHGFFNYHYLMLKTIDTKDGRRRFVGVPGIYEQPERMMALLFGFPEFEASEDSKYSRQQSGKDSSGVFGYWMCPVAEE